MRMSEKWSIVIFLFQIAFKWKRSPYNYHIFLFQEWTILDCNFGVPLFDVDANTKICHAIASMGLAKSER